MATELKTKKTDSDVNLFLNLLEDESRKADCYKVLGLMKEVTKSEPKMWGANIIGFVDFHYQYASGRQGDWFLMGFSPRKQYLTIYAHCNEKLIEQSIALGLGKFKNGKGCLYVKKLEDINLDILKEILKNILDDHKQTL